MYISCCYHGVLDSNHERDGGRQVLPRFVFFPLTHHWMRLKDKKGKGVTQPNTPN